MWGQWDLTSLESHHLPHLGQCHIFGARNYTGSKAGIQSMVLIERLHGINKGKAQEWQHGLGALILGAAGQMVTPLRPVSLFLSAGHGLPALKSIKNKLLLPSESTTFLPMPHVLTGNSFGIAGVSANPGCLAADCGHSSSPSNQRRLSRSESGP